MSQVKGTFLISKRMKDDSRFPRDHFMAGINHPPSPGLAHITQYTPEESNLFVSE